MESQHALLVELHLGISGQLCLSIKRGLWLEESELEDLVLV